jgi:uncharacterized membrane protein (UPF0136 family)
MRLPGIVILVYSLFVLGGGIIGYATAGSVASVIAGSTFGLGLRVWAYLGAKSWGLFSPLL